MAATINKQLLHSVIDALPPEELHIVYRMLSGFIEDYLDEHLTPAEYDEHLQALEDIRRGEFTLLSNLPD